MPSLWCPLRGPHPSPGTWTGSSKSGLPPVAKLLWLSWFGGQLGKSVMEPMLRVGIDLLDLRRALRKERRR